MYNNVNLLIILNSTLKSSYIRQMSGQVSCGSAGEYQADEWAGVTRTSWRLSVR